MGVKINAMMSSFKKHKPDYKNISKGSVPQIIFQNDLSKCFIASTFVVLGT